MVEVAGRYRKVDRIASRKGMAKQLRKRLCCCSEGLTGVYVDHNVAAVVEVNAETDFKLRNAQFVELVNATAKGSQKENQLTTKKFRFRQCLQVKPSAYVSATATIGEKSHSVALFDWQQMHNTSSITTQRHYFQSAISVIEGGDE